MPSAYATVCWVNHLNGVNDMDWVATGLIVIAVAYGVFGVWMLVGYFLGCDVPHWMLNRKPWWL